MKRLNNRMRSGRQAFTLVELIVVLVILAVLAAMLVPALTGYVKRAKREKYYEQAYYARVASQSVMTELYSKGDVLVPISNSKDSDWTSNKYGDQILSYMGLQRGDNEPYILMFGVGSYDKYKDDADKSTLPYTVLFVAYVADKNAPAVFYVDGTWTYSYPWNDKSITGGSGKPNAIGVGPNTGTEITLCIVSNRTKYPDISKSGFWTGAEGLKDHSDP